MIKVGDRVRVNNLSDGYSGLTGKVLEVKFYGNQRHESSIKFQPDTWGDDDLSLFYYKFDLVESPSLKLEDYV
jgi:hypothetical protein